MSKINFVDTVIFSDLHHKTKAEKLFELSESYLSPCFSLLGGRKFCILPLQSPKQSCEVTFIENKKHPFIYTAAKVLSYATVVIPVIALVVKVVFRSIYKFHMVPNQEQILTRVKELLPDIENKKDNKQIKWVSKNDTLVFTFEDTPNLVFKLVANAEKRAEETEKQLQNILKAKEVCLAHNLDLLHIPSARKLEIEIEGKCYDLIEEEAIKMTECTKQDLETTPSLQQANEQLKLFIAKTGFYDIEPKVISVDDKTKPYSPQKIALVDFQHVNDPERSFLVGNFDGQLGNQLFEIAATVALALDNNATPVFPELETSDSLGLKKNFEKIFNRLNTKLPKPLEVVIRQQGFEYSPIPYYPNARLIGYFQSEKFFKHHKDKILELFKTPHEIEAHLQKQYAHIINDPKTVSVHYRAYHREASADLHPVLSSDYINKATKAFDEDSTFVVFSDDIAFARERFDKLGKKNVVYIQDDYWNEIYLMSKCKNNIIANSSFSWWGAYLNQNPEKRVYAPSPLTWFGPSLKHLETQDLIPSEWTIIQ